MKHSQSIVHGYFINHIEILLHGIKQSNALKCGLDTLTLSGTSQLVHTTTDASEIVCAPKRFTACTGLSRDPHPICRVMQEVPA